MHTGFDILESSKDLRHHWARRFAAGSIDMLIIFVPFYMVLYYFDLPYKTIITGVGAGLIWFIYSGYFEGRYGRTLGKLLVHLKVVSMRERRLYHQTFVRSIQNCSGTYSCPSMSSSVLQQRGTQESDGRTALHGRLSSHITLRYQGARRYPDQGPE